MEIKKLEDIADLYNGARLDRRTTDTYKHPVLKRRVTNNIPQTELLNVSKSIDERYLSKKDDIVISVTHKTEILKLDVENIIIPMYYMVIRVKENYDSNYIFYLLKNKLLQENWDIITEGTSLKTIKLNLLKNIKVPVISLEKQKNYGAIVNLLEKKIRLSNDLVIASEKLEKSLLNKILED